MRLLAYFLISSVAASATFCLVQAEPATVGIESRLLGVELDEPLRGSLSVELAGGLVREDHDGPQPSEILRRDISLPSTSHLELPVGTLVRIQVEAAGWWAPSMAVMVEPETAVTIPLRPTGTLEAQLEAPRGHALPEEMEVRITSAPRGPGEPPGEAQLPPIEGLHDIPCPITEGSLACALPTGLLDIRLRARGFASVQRWDLAIPAGETQTLGVLKLTPGASVVGRVGVGEELLEAGLAYDPEEVTLELAPHISGFSGGRDLERQEDRTYTVKADERGFYQLTEVPPGSYALVGHHEGLTSATLEPIQVHAGQETQLRSLELLPPRRITVRIQPPRDPWGQPWTLRIQEAGQFPGHWLSATTGKTQGEGLFEAADLQPGLHAVIVQDSRGGSWKRQELELVDSHTTHEIDLPYARLEALVLLSDEPLTGAQVHFGGRRSSERISRRTNEEGKVYVFLPHRDGGWLADVEHKGLGLRSRVRGITLERSPDEPWAKTVIEVPDTRLFGEVVDEQGNPLPESLVDVKGDDSDGESVSMTVHTEGPEANFTARGLAPGTWHVEARAYSRDEDVHYFAERQGFEVPEDSPTGPVQLIARREHVVTGQVVSPTGEGLPGALVVALVEHGARLLTSSVEYKHTGSDGTFELRLPGRAPAVVLTVFPPGFAVRQERFQLPTSGPVLLPVDPAAGTLVVRSADGETKPDLFREDTLFGPYVLIGAFLDRWAGMHVDGSPATEPGTLIIPGLEPREYAVCDIRPADAVLLGPVVPEGPCDRGYLRPGGVLELTVPAPAKDSAAEGR